MPRKSKKRSLPNQTCRNGPDEDEEVEAHDVARGERAAAIGGARARRAGPARCGSARPTPKARWPSVAPAGEDVRHLAERDDGDPDRAVGEQEQLGPALGRVRREESHARMVRVLRSCNASCHCLRCCCWRGARAGRRSRAALEMVTAAASGDVPTIVQARARARAHATGGSCSSTSAPPGASRAGASTRPRPSTSSTATSRSCACSNSTTIATARGWRWPATRASYIPHVRPARRRRTRLGSARSKARVKGDGAVDEIVPRLRALLAP